MLPLRARQAPPGTARPSRRLARGAIFEQQAGSRKSGPDWQEAGLQDCYQRVYTGEHTATGLSLELRPAFGSA